MLEGGSSALRYQHDDVLGRARSQQDRAAAAAASNSCVCVRVMWARRSVKRSSYITRSNRLARLVIMQEITVFFFLDTSPCMRTAIRIIVSNHLPNEHPVKS
jgi:hypothetical protein